MDGEVVFRPHQHHFLPERSQIPLASASKVHLGVLAPFKTFEYQIQACIFINTVLIRWKGGKSSTRGILSLEDLNLLEENIDQELSAWKHSLILMTSDVTLQVLRIQINDPDVPSDL